MGKQNKPDPISLPENSLLKFIALTQIKHTITDANEHKLLQ